MNQFLRSAFADALDHPTRYLKSLQPLSSVAALSLEWNQVQLNVCSNFPREICHDFHPGYDHTLIIKPFKLANSRDQFHCAVCGVDDSELSLFKSYYCCDSCNFNLHVECASIPITLNLKVKYPLHLFFSLPMNAEAATLSCSICTKAVPSLGCWVFYNHDHVYLCHFDCAAMIEFSIKTDSLAQLLNPLRTLAVTYRPPARANQPSGGMTHYTHHHSLKGYNSAKCLRCNLCDFVFTTGYICGGCNYFIDNICFSLPSKIQHVSSSTPSKVNLVLRLPICESQMSSLSILYRRYF